MVWTGCIVYEKYRCDFMARTFKLIAPVQPKLHRVSCSKETIPNAPKHCETNQNMSLGSNGVDWVVRREKFRHNFVAQTFALIASVQHSLHQVSCINKTIQNAPKHHELHQNISLGSNGGGSGAFIAKNSDTTSWHKLLH